MVAYSILGRKIIVILKIVVDVLLLAVIAHITWLYRQGSSPISRLGSKAPVVLRSRQLDPRDKEHGLGSGRSTEDGRVSRIMRSVQ